ncbi:MAG: hypothetical protein IE923_03640 [Micrococcales bacterium]|nr:hypothetical protein [Micrococcales bacterium]
MPEFNAYPPSRATLPTRWSHARGLAAAWTGVLVLSGAVRAVAGGAMVWPALWALSWAAVVVLVRVQGTARSVAWAVLHAASHLCWITGHPTGWASVAVVVPALAASVSLCVLWRGSAGAWSAGATTVTALVVTVDRLLGGAS